MMDLEENLKKCRVYIKALEDEKRKIEMFRRELPLCLNLVTEAIESYRHQLSGPANTTTTATTTTTITEHCLNRSHSDCSEQTTSNDEDGGCPMMFSEFMPIKRRQPSTSTTEGSERENEEEEEESCEHHESRSLDIDINSDINECKLMINCDLNDKACSTSSCSSPAGGEKVDWLRSVQLWNQSSDLPTTTHNEEDQTSLRPRKVQVVEVNNGAGSIPFQNETISQVHDCSNIKTIAISTTNQMEHCPVDMEIVSGSGSGTSCSIKKDQDHDHDHDHVFCSKDKDSNGQSRKARRCWSADLHKKFLNALQHLGGSHVATPKQIRELMKVDGLTNDEVKSHLQKYRLNSRRPSPAIHNGTSTSHQAPQFVVVGGIWVPSPPEYTSKTMPAPSQSGLHPPVEATSVMQKLQPPHNHLHHSREEIRGNLNKNQSHNNNSSSNGRCGSRGASSFSGLLVSN